jgi:hypothetical protein
MRRAIIGQADPSLITTLSECSLNTLNGAQPISPRCKALLTKYKGQLRQLAAPIRTVSIQRKRRILQSGGFLSILLSSLLGGLINRLTSS